MIVLAEHTRVYLAVGATDLRQQIDGLAAVLADVREQDPFSACRFIFGHRRRDKLQRLYGQHNGFWLWYRRLERERFHGPPATGAWVSIAVSARELRWLVMGGISAVSRAIARPSSGAFDAVYLADSMKEFG